ncbi:unnamed protein product [Plutella xylostella]|uniref:Protein arginine N-methyltransferase n=1 Tax=Plutella xylostella TaxID=51655 RepID=A0A8S4D0U2_PLUXY|nr:unnamed protein product [Plutella xylostella]
MNYNLTLRFIKCLVLPTIKRFKSSSKVSEVKMSQVFKQVRNPLTGSMDWDVQHEEYDTFQDIARAAFADMLHDTERNKKYQRALELAIQKMHEQGKPANVLDIGTGTGLLSMMAARAGADSIVACEAFEPMAECCLKILAKNGLADKIKVIPKRSTELTVGEEGDLKQRANILVTEVFDTELIGEGALSTFSHAHKHLLEADCIVVPDSAVIYAQVVECPTMQKWNKVNDLVDEDLNVVLRTPQKMKDCPETAAVHDIQLSQLPRSSFKLLSEPLPVFYYDWSGKSPVDFNRTVRQSFVAKQTGAGQMVFMWWDLNMDTEGKIVLSCAPWWNHPDVNLEAERPQDTIPWRDHWMQAVYYFPKSVMLSKDTEASLISCQDEYSLWFYLEDEKTKFKEYKRPACECGFHLTFSRTHISYLNDGTRSKKFLARLKEVLNPNSIVLDLNGSSLMGLAAAKMAKTVYIHEDKKVNLGIQNEYCQANDINNITFIPEITEEIAAQADVIICDPCFKTSIQPWHSLMQYAHTVLKLKPKLKGSVEMVPDSCELWAMPVDFYDLQKIRVPVKKCEGFDMAIFDELVEGARQISDDELDAQPLWEYPCRARGPPQQLLHVDFADVKERYTADNECPIINPPSDKLSSVNGFALWSVYRLGAAAVSAGPSPALADSHLVSWDMRARQAVHILEKTHVVTKKNKWKYHLICDLEKGKFSVNMKIILPQ